MLLGVGQEKPPRKQIELSHGLNFAINVSRQPGPGLGGCRGERKGLSCSLVRNMMGAAREQGEPRSGGRTAQGAAQGRAPRAEEAPPGQRCGPFLKERGMGGGELRFREETEAGSRRGHRSPCLEEK